MAATSRFVLFDVDANGEITAQSYDTAASGSSNGRGTLGYAQSNSVADDTITVTPGVAEDIQVNIDGNGLNEITLTSGTDIDSRTIARDISFKCKQLAGSEFDFVQCEYINNKFRVYSSKLGPGSEVDFAVGTNDISEDLKLTTGGSPDYVNVDGVTTDNSGTYQGTLTVSGVFRGQFDDIYTIIFTEGDHLVGDAVADGGNTYAGTVETAGDFNDTIETYTITVDGSSDPVMNGGQGNVPVMTWTSSPSSDNDATGVELLYSDYYYEVGTKGVRIKFSDVPFGSSDEFTVACIAASGGVNAIGSAQYQWDSRREGKSTTGLTSSATGEKVGNLGIEAFFSTGSNVTAGDEFRIICSGPQPTTLGVTTLNYGSVTVSTYSPVKAVWFELTSGATILSNTKFGLQSDGTAQHHNQGNSDTLFGFGTAGAGTPAGSDPTVQTEWRTGVTAADLDSDTPPDYLSASKANLDVVATADNSEAIGVAAGQMISDFVYLTVKLGATETGANPSIVYRQFFDFS